MNGYKIFVIFSVAQNDEHNTTVVWLFRFSEEGTRTLYAEAVLKFAKLNTASVASRSVCSRAKHSAHTGFGINFIANL
jgi:hypothetical protein